MYTIIAPAVNAAGPEGTKMAQATRRHATSEDRKDGMEQLRRSDTMARLLDAMEQGTDVGHYGHFTFVTVARHFMDESAVERFLAGQPGMDESKARALIEHVKERGYNPPRRERILEHQGQGGFQIIEDPKNPDSGNLYRELQFPEAVYEDINEYYEEKAEAR